MLDWKSLTIAEALKEASERWGDNEALVHKDLRLSYSGLYQQACQLASGMNKLGIQRGDHVATIFDIVPEWIIVKYALHILGAVIVPINVNFKAKEIEFALKQADVKSLITFDKLRYGHYLDILAEVDGEISSAKERRIQSKALPCLEKIICLSPDKNRYPYCYDYYDVIDSGADYKTEDIDGLSDQVKPNDICNILFTSGSTAFPKGAVHAHTSILGIGSNIIGKTFDLNPSNRVLCYFPFYHVAGCVYFPLGALTSGCALHVNEFVPDEILAIIQEEKINLYVGFEAHFNALVNHPNFKDYDLGSVKFILLAVGPEWYDRCRRIFPGVEIVANHYGFTEGTGVSVMPDEGDYQIRKYTNGKPWPGIEVKAVDPVTGEKVPPDVAGELCLRGWSRMREYYKNPEETNKSIDSEGFFHSGDYGWLDEGGNVVYRGRYKMMIKTGGENVSQREVEIFLEGIPGIKSVQVIGLPDERWGEAITAIIEVEEGAKLTKEGVVDFCKDKIARYKIPKNVLFIDGVDWPLLGAGKVNKIELKEWAIERMETK
jgi:fatty-acyl-CoA synthase